MSDKDPGWVSRTLGRLFGTAEKSSPSEHSSHSKPDATGEQPGRTIWDPPATGPYHCDFWAEDKEEKHVKLNEPFSLTVKRSIYRQHHKSKPVIIEATKVEQHGRHVVQNHYIINPGHFLQGEKARYWDREQLSLTFDDLRMSVKGKFLIRAIIWETQKWPTGLDKVYFGTLYVT
ncbi:hypothetical protein F4813DRAFT_359423 [Daldinia decipiens]|uniref:uncharacterized protein n=1 Tax=Daldinia decipiens TaxID=326647 RepID=UPI0020C594B4|nr:uncharacterized protein F4813DRAFT_359423 [Daldinia decipiens]KAI1657748.1 hypothetical protein F4813DRAFT_359423 [Daldinia decipiens]